jgi:hypothetical protein
MAPPPAEASSRSMPVVSGKTERSSCASSGTSSRNMYKSPHPPIIGYHQLDVMNIIVYSRPRPCGKLPHTPYHLTHESAPLHSSGRIVLESWKD